MPNWKKLIVSGSDASLNSLDVSNNISASNLYVKDEIIHYGDTNTKIKFTDDTIVLKAGGGNFIELSEGTTDLITLNRNVSASGNFTANHITASGNISASSGTHIFSDQVGINTAPASGIELHVNGDVRVDSTNGVATRKIRSGYFSLTTDIAVASGISGSVLLQNGNNTVLTLSGSNREAEFAGNIVSSGDISSSGTGSFDYMMLGGATSLTEANTRLEVTGQINVGGQGNSGVVRAHKGKFGQIVNRTSGNNIIEFTGDNNVSILGPITASGDISASGKVITTEIEGSSITLDSAGDIVFDADGADIALKDGGTEFGRFKRDNSDFVIKSATCNKDIVFRGNDGGSTITAMTIDMSEAGKVGIGTTTPAEKLTVEGNISSSGQLNISTAENLVATFESTDQNAQVNIKDNSATTALVHSLHAFKIQVDPSNADGNSNFRVEIDGDEKFRIDNGGDVGIGTSANAPEKLTVAGNVSASGKLYLDTVDNASSDPDKFLVLSGNEVEYRTGTQLLSDIGGQSSGNYVVDAGGAVCQVGVWSSATDMSGSACLLFDTSTNKLGIGDNTPCKTLTVDLNNTNTTVLTGNGLSGGGAGSGLLIQNAAVDSAGLYANLDFRAYNADGRIAYVYNGTNDGDFHFITDNGADPKTRFFIENDGKIGIGTTSPANTLHVSSSDEVVAKFQSSDNKAVIQISDDDTTGYVSAENSRISIGPQQGLHANNINILTSNYNVGIGTATPTVDLDVRGNAIIAGSEPDAPVGTAATLEVYESGSDSILAIHQDDSSSSTKVAALRFRNGGNDTCLKVPTSNQGLIIDTEGKANAFVLGVCGQIQSAITASCNFSSSAQVLTNTLNIQGAVNAGSDTDKFLVLDADGNVDFRTGDEVKTDIGAVGSSGVSDAGGANCQVAVWSSGTAISGSNCFFFDTATNRLGIGTASPAQDLHVLSSANYQGIFLNGSNAPNIGFRKGSTTSAAWKVGISGNCGCFFSISTGTANTDRLVVDDSGSVAIGFNTPKAKLHVAGEISGSNNVRLQGHCLILGGGQTIIRNYSTYLGLFAAGGSAKDVKAKSLALTNDFGNSAPTNGLYVQGTACFGSNVVINGTVTAQEFNTELVSASVVFESGSTQFGNSLDDTHTFTGSILLSGSQTIDIGGRNLYFCSTGAGGWPQIDADSNLFLGGGNAGNIQFMDHAIPSGDSSIDLGNANRYYRALYADEAFLGNAISHVQTITGSVLVTGSTCLTGDLFLGDNRKVVLGSGTDMLLYHNGTDSVIDNNTGDLYITNKADNKDIIFRSDDGSEGFTPYFRLDGSDERLIVEAPNGMLFYDNKKAKFGNGSDLEIYHDTTDNIIKSNVSRLRFYSGSSEFFRIQGGSNEATLFTKNVRLQDNVRLDVGGSTDGRFFHDGTDTQLVTITGDLIIKNGSGGDIRLQSGSTEYFRLDASNTNMVASKTILFSDNVKASFGNSEDLRIVHNGTNTEFNNYNGGVNFVQNQADGDIIFYADGGSGTAAEYFRLDGGLVQTIFTKPLVANGIISASGAITGSTLNLQGIVNAGSDTDKFLVLDSSGNVDFRTGANVLSDIGAQGSGNYVVDAGGAAGQVGVWSSATDMSGSNNLFFETSNNRLGIGTNSPSKTLHAYHATVNEVAQFESGDSGAFIQFKDNNSDQIPSLGAIGNNLTFRVSGSEAARFDVNGRLGIGTTNPNQKLTVAGNIYANGGQLFVNNNCCLAAVGNLKLVTHDGGYNTTMFLSSSGNVGVGTTTPPHTLSVQGTISRLNSSGVQIVNLLASSDHGQIKVLNSSGTERILLNSNGLSYFNGGDVAIGRTSQLDSAKLSIQADSGEDVIGIQTNDNSSTTKLLNVFNSSGTDIVSITANNDSTPDLMFNVDDGSGNITQVLKLDSSQNAFFSGDTTLTSGSVNIETFQEGVQFYNGSNYTANRIKLTSAQNLQFLAGGSFQFTPNSTMQLLAGKRFIFKNADNSTCIGVHNGGSVGARLDFEDASGNVKMAISSSGNVGIGTTTPSEKLEVDGGTENAFIQLTTPNTKYAGIKFGDPQSSIAGRIQYYHGDNSMQFDTDGTFTFEGGNLGIGGSPGAKLDVNSGATNTVAIFESSDDKAFIKIKDNDTDTHLITKDSKFHVGSTSSDYNKFNVNISTGRVGIGTNAPKENLHIVSGSGSGNKTVIRVGGNGDGNNESVLELVEHISGDHMNYGYSFIADGNSTNNLLIKNHNNSSSGNTAISVERVTGRVGIGHSDTYGEVLDISGSIVIRDIGSTRGIRRNNEAYDLRLLGGTTISNGAHISLGGDLRGGSGNSLAGAAVITQGGDNYANRAAVSSSISFQVCSNAGSATDMFIQGCSGNVGIGTTSPSTKLVVGGVNDVHGLLLAQQTNNTDYSSRLFLASNNVTSSIIGRGGGIAFNVASVIGSTSGAEKVRITSTGNVGIGTTAPSKTLTVAGDISGSGRLHIDTVDNASSDTDKILVLNGNEVEYRTGTQILSDVGGVGAPKVVYESLSSAIAVDGTKTIPNSLSYTLSSNNYEYLEVFLDGIRLARDIDYSETNTTTITSLMAIPSASVLTFKILG